MRASFILTLIHINLLSFSPLNSSLNGLSFAQDAEGNWGYKAPGADTVFPFKKYGSPTILYSNGVYGRNVGTLSTTVTMPKDGMCVVFAVTCGATSFLTPAITLNSVQQTILASYKVDENTKGGNVACFSVKKGDAVYVSASKIAASNGQSGIIILII